MMVVVPPPPRCCFLLLLVLCFVHGCVSLTEEEEIEWNRGLTGEEDPLDGSVRVSLADRKVLDGWLTTIFLPVLYIVVFVVALPTNAMALWVFAFRTKKQHPASIYMANLALSDLMFVVWLPLKISYHLNGNNWIYGEPLCKVLVAFFYANMYCSSIFIACISVQRYWGVVHPLARGQRGQNRVTACVCACVWAAVWLLTVPLYLYDQTVREKSLDILTCHDITRPSQKNMAAGYFLTMALLGFVVPSAVCVVAYGLMLRTLRTSMSSAAVTKNRRKAVVLVITVVVMFLLCFTPSNIMLVVHYCLMLAGRTNNMYAFYVTTLCLASLNSCVDPFIYYFISEEFRNHVKNTIICRSVRKADRMKVSFSALKKKSNSSSAAYTSSDGNTQSTSC